MNNLHKLLISAILLVGFGNAQIFINEVDYDQPLTDVSEFFELAGPAGTYDLVVVEMVNGSNNSIYLTAELGTVTLTNETNGYGFFVVGGPTIPNVDFTPSNWPEDNVIQNGAPDALVLRIGGIIVDAVAYEGYMIDANSNVMENAGEDETSTGELLSLGRMGLDPSPWLQRSSSPGEINIDQTFDPNVNYAPIANAGPDQIQDNGATITLDGTSSIDTDGSIVSYSWEQISGPEVILTDSDLPTATAILPSVNDSTNWVFTLTITDDEGASSSDGVVIFVNIIETITIAEARALGNGSWVAIKGLINSVNIGSGWSDYTVQDSTAGIRIYDNSSSPYAFGDEIIMMGNLSSYGGMKQLWVEISIVTSTGNSLPDPQLITVAELYANGENYESELIRINNITNEGSGDIWPQMGGDANLSITDNGTDLATMRIDRETEVDGQIEPSWPQDVIGIGGEWEGDYQIMPRFLSDFQSYFPLDLISIAEAREVPLGRYVSINGLVNSVNFSSTGTFMSFEDSTAGIVFYYHYYDEMFANLEIGDEIHVTGQITEYGGVLEIVPHSSLDVSIISTGNTLPDPQVITVYELNENGANFESELIRLNGVSKIDVGALWPEIGVNASIGITDNGIDQATLLIDLDTQIDGTVEPPWPRDIIGVAGIGWDASITPRFISDFSSCSPTSFDLLFPINDTVMVTLLPEFLWQASIDPDDAGFVLNKTTGKNVDQENLVNSEIRSIVGYEIYIGQSNDFSDSIVDQVLGTSHIFLQPLIENKHYYWRVTAIDDSGDIAISDTASFWVNSLNSPPEAPTLTSPEDGATGLSAVPTFNWEAANDPDPFDTLVYTIQISTDSNFSNIAFETYKDTATFHEMTIWMPTDTEYWWRVIATDIDSLTTESEVFNFTVGYVSIAEEIALPTEFMLDQNFPNPFNPSTTIRYGLPEDSNVSLVIYDVRGQVVQTIASEHQSAGWYGVVWNGQTADGKTLSTGIYFARLVAGEYSKVIKMLYLK